MNEDGRAEPAGWSSAHSWEEQANYLISYYQNLCAIQDDEPWLLGLYMAKQWLRYLDEPRHNAQELREFLRVLESQIQNQGSGWLDLCWRVRNWVAQIERRELDTQAPGS